MPLAAPITMTAIMPTMARESPTRATAPSLLVPPDDPEDPLPEADPLPPEELDPLPPEDKLGGADGVKVADGLGIHEDAIELG